MFIGSPGKYTVNVVYSRDGTIAAATSTETAVVDRREICRQGRPVMIVHAQQNFPAVGRCWIRSVILKIIEGWMRGSQRWSAHAGLGETGDSDLGRRVSAKRDARLFRPP